MVIGLVGAAVAAIVGCIYGGISAYCGGKVDTIMMRIVEVITSIPYLIVVILLSVVLDSKSLGTLILALTITGWCGTARLVRGQILQLKSQEFVMAAQALGVKPLRIIVKHLIPNTMSTIIVPLPLPFRTTFLGSLPQLHWSGRSAPRHQLGRLVFGSAGAVFVLSVSAVLPVAHDRADHAVLHSAG